MSRPLEARRVIARNTAWNYAGFAVNLATNLVAFPFVVSRLGDAASGVWLLLGSVTGYMGLLELGLVPSLAQYVGAAIGRGAHQEVNRAASTAMALLGGLALVPLGLAVVAPWLVSFLHVDAAARDAFVLALRVAIVGFALRMPLATLQAMLLGAQRQDRASQLWILMGWAKFACALAVLQSGGGLAALVTSEAAVHLAGGVLQWVWVRREMPALRFAPHDVDPRVARDLLTYGASLAAVGVTVLIIEQTDRLVIAAFLPIERVTLYAAAWKLYMLAYAVPTTLVQAVGPMVATLSGRGEQAAIQQLFLRFSKYCLTVALPMIATLAACREWLLAAWMGPRFAEAGPVVLVLLATFYVTAHNYAGWSVLGGLRRLNVMAWVYNGPQAILNLGLSIALVKPLGIVGVALGTLVPAVLLQPVFLRFATRTIGVSLGTYVRTVVLPTTSLAALAFLPLVLVCLATAPGAWVRVAAAAACGAAYLVAVWFKGLDATERAGVLGMLPFLKTTARV